MSKRTATFAVAVLALAFCVLAAADTAQAPGAQAPPAQGGTDTAQAPGAQAPAAQALAAAEAPAAQPSPAQTPAEEEPAAEEPAAPATPAEEAPPAQALAGEGAAPELTADELFEKVADVYTSLETYYEKTSLEVGPAEAAVERLVEGSYEVSLRRGGGVRVDFSMSGAGVVRQTLHFAAGEFTVYMRGDNRYQKHEIAREGMVKQLISYGSPAALAFAEDPVAALKEDVTEVGAPELVVRDGREFYRVTLKQPGILSTLFFDAGSHLLREQRCEFQDRPGRETVLHTVVERVVTDRIPEDFPGGEKAFASFELPEGAELFEPPRPQVETHKLMGKPAPDFELPDLDGGTLRLSDLRGKVVLLDFWAIQCPPCRRAIPALVKLEEELAGEPFVYYAVNLMDTAEAIRQFAKNEGVDIPSLPAGGTDVGARYMIGPIPTFVIVGREGVVRDVQAGFYNVAPLERSVRKLLREGAQAGERGGPERSSENGEAAGSASGRQEEQPSSKGRAVTP